MSDPSEITLSTPNLPADPAPEDGRPDTPTYSGFVAILGKPNVGKSTLLNTLLGVKVAPITPKPQTTRRGVRGVYTDRQDSGVRQLVFVDTPGFHRAKDALGEFMNREVRAAVVDVDVILWVVDLRRPPNDEDKEVARLLRGLDPNTRVYLVGNKLDAAKYPDEALELYKALAPTVHRTYSLSALEDPGAVYALRGELLGELTEGPLFFPEDIRSDQPRETWAAEIIRESAMTHLRQELPYAVAVRVLEWRDPEGEEPLYLMAELWVERANQRMIVLGKGGSMIRDIGRTARKQLEVFLGHRVFLELEVVVRRAWREDPEALRELGFEG
jgi:GTP-binding protein Era